MFILISILVMAIVQVEKAASENVDLDFSEASNAFALDLYAKATAGRTGSLIMSPASIQRVLTMASFGAIGKTKNEILAGLKYPEDLTNNDIARNCEILTENLRQSAFLKMATKIFYAKDLSIKPEFNNFAKKRFGSETQAIDFIKNQEAAKVINNWVKSQTNNKIQDLVSSSDFTNETRLVLVNAIYFLGNWEIPFDPKETVKDTFYNSGVTPFTVDMMNIKDDFKYCEFPSLDATAIQMLYKESDISMLFVLPNSKTGLKGMEDKLKSTLFEDILKDMNTVEVIVSLPKFRVESYIELDEILKSMGMKTMFSSKADFSEITDEKGIFISKVIQKAFIEVNELGTEAAAATAIVAPGVDARTPMFIADHPFMYAIFNDDGIYFTGRVEKF